MTDNVPADQIAPDSAAEAQPPNMAEPMMVPIPLPSIESPIAPDTSPEVKGNDGSLPAFEDLTFAEVLTLMIWHPVQTTSLLVDTLSRPVRNTSLDAAVAVSTPATTQYFPAERTFNWRIVTGTAAAIDWKTLSPLLAISVAFLVTLFGSVNLATADRGLYGDRIPFANVILGLFGLGLIVFAIGLNVGLIRNPGLLERSTRWKVGVYVAGFVLCVVAVLATLAPNPDLTLPNKGQLPIGSSLMLIGALVMTCTAMIALPMRALPPLEAAGTRQQDDDSEIRVITPEEPGRLERLILQYGLRATLFVSGILLSILAWIFNTDNQFTQVGVFAWILSIFCWIFFVNNQPIPFEKWFDRERWSKRLLEPFRRTVSFQFRLSWVVPVMVVILLAGAWFRFNNLEAYPPDMTSDHVEKLLDAGKVYDGQRPVFFPNNGGREAFQMYYLAVLKEITGLPFNFDLLKIGSGLEGMLSILLAFWMGRALIGDEDKALADLTGVILAALVATSYWATMLARLGLRIVITTDVTMALMIFLARALRHNRRLDYIIAGLILGAGMYGYQAVRMLPLVVVVGLIVAIIVRARTWHARRQYVVNLAALVLVSLAVFVPLGNYMVEYPDYFWSRTTGRLFGEPTKEIKDPQTGSVVTVAVPTSERIAAFQENFPKLLDNWRRSTMMFNWSGDAAWVTGSVEREPEMDGLTGALFVLGLGLLGARALRRRDPVDWLLPIGIVIMLLPTALSIAYPIEVPSSTRASGALPLAYFVAALGLAFMLREISRRITARGARYAIYALTVIMLILGMQANAYMYFGVAMTDYRDSTFPYHQAGTVLKGFIDSTGAPGNAFMVASDYWWDHRSLALESGDRFWNNGLFHDHLRQRILDMMKANMQQQPGRPFIYQLHPDRQLLFFLRPGDTDTITTLQAMFPNGEMIEHQTFDPQRNFLTYIAPPVGCQWMAENVGSLPDSCANDQSAPQSVPSQ